MKKLLNLTLIACAFAAVVTLGSCSDESGELGEVVDFIPNGTIEGTDVLEAYASDVVISRYVTLASAAKNLYEKVYAISDSGSDDAVAMSAACDAWKEARIAWERTEAYLFGPVDDAGIDPGIDSWPLSMGDLATSINNYAAGNGHFDDDDIKANDGSLKGFHAIEFMLFEDGEDKTQIDQFNETDAYDPAFYGFDLLSASALKQYLVAITKELYRCTVLLVAEWDSTNANLSSYSLVYTDGVTALDDGDYYSTFTQPSSTNSDFKSEKAALSIIPESASGIANEVGAVKISDPLTSESVLDVESWFSHNSIADFTNNIIGIKEAYYGVQFDDAYSDNTKSPAVNSLSAYVASASSDLDATVKTAIDAAIAAVQAMQTYDGSGNPIPFRDNLDATASENVNAVAACLELEAVLVKVQTAVNQGYYVK